MEEHIAQVRILFKTIIFLPILNSEAVIFIFSFSGPFNSSSLSMCNSSTILRHCVLWNRLKVCYPHPSCNLFFIITFTIFFRWTSGSRNPLLDYSKIFLYYFPSINLFMDAFARYNMQLNHQKCLYTNNDHLLSLDALNLQLAIWLSRTYSILLGFRNEVEISTKYQSRKSQ